MNERFGDLMHDIDVMLAMHPNHVRLVLRRLLLDM